MSCWASPPMSSTARAASIVAQREAQWADTPDTGNAASRAARRRVALGLFRALTLQLASLQPDALVEVAAWLSKPENVVWMAKHVIDVAGLNVDEERNKQSLPQSAAT